MSNCCCRTFDACPNLDTPQQCIGTCTGDLMPEQYEINIPHDMDYPSRVDSASDLDFDSSDQPFWNPNLNYTPGPLASDFILNRMDCSDYDEDQCCRWCGYRIWDVEPDFGDLPLWFQTSGYELINGRARMRLEIEYTMDNRKLSGGGSKVVIHGISMKHSVWTDDPNFGYSAIGTYGGSVAGTAFERDCFDPYTFDPLFGNIGVFAAPANYNAILMESSYVSYTFMTIRAA